MELAHAGFVLVAFAQLVVLATFFKIFMIRRARATAGQGDDSAESHRTNGGEDGTTDGDPGTTDDIGRPDRGNTGSADGSAATIDADTEAIACTECGERNEAGYRFCRRCIEELPGSGSRLHGGSSPGRRGIF